MGVTDGNRLGEKHGAYASLARLRADPRCAQIAGDIRASAPVYSPADEPVVPLLALVLLRVERAVAALAAVDTAAGEGRELGPYLVDDGGKHDRLWQDLRGWVSTARYLCSDLGMTPTSRARLGLDLAGTEDHLGPSHPGRG